MAFSLFSKLAVCLAVLSFPQSTLSLGKTDTITWGGDTSRAGYETNHNIDQQTVSSSDFGNIWTAKLPGNFNGIGAEQVLSQPLVYTTSDGIQYVFVATTQNNLYKINAKTGQIVNTRNLGVPFMATDLGGCNDIYPAIGVSGTGVIDPASGLWYMTSKTYSDQYQTVAFGLNTAPGRANGRYYFHAISTEDLSEAPNFPTPLHQTPFRNNKNRWLVAGDQHQRPALLQVGDYIYTGWASHCIQYNYTGAIIGFHKTTGAIVESYAMQGGLEPNTVPGGGVWMSGGGLTYDGAGSMFFSTGNGYASQLPATGHPVAGRNVPTALEEAVVHMNINGDGTLSPVDFFMPWEKTQLDGADKDLGTTPFQLLPSAFSCPNDRRVGVITGKSGKTYFLNADNLGGYQQGANRLDDAIFVFQHENSVYSAVGVMPLGKYIYVNVINYNTRVFQWSCNANGDGAVTEITTAAEKNAQPIGVGHGTTTSVDGREGTGLYWMTDVEGPKLRIYDSTPPSSGPLKLLRSFNFGNPGKFAHPVFGDGKAYLGATGALYAFGSPVNLPLNCTGPIAFAKTSVNGTSPALPITCTANVATSVTGFNISGSANFAIVQDSLPTLPLTLTAGKQFTFQARFTPRAVGPLSSDVVITTSNAAAGSSSSTPVTLSGLSNSAAPLFSIQPITVTFNSTVGAGEVQKSVFFNNDGDTAVTVSNIQFSVKAETGPWIAANTTNDGRLQVAEFTFANLPSTISANTRQAVGISYNPPSAGNHVVFVRVTTNGGTKLLNVLGATGSAPNALFEFQKPDGSGWVEYVPGQNFTFGNVTPGAVLSLQMRITNNGSNTASPLGLTVSKPPFGVTGFVKAANAIDLAEGTQIPAGQSANATVFCAPPERQVNTPDTQAVAPWRINTNSDQGAVVLTFACNAAALQVGPLLNNGSARHPYLGCYQDQTPGRQLASLLYTDSNNTAGRCIDLCSAGGFNFTGLTYGRECWCGNALPLRRGTSDDCNFRCSGDNNHTCGGNGIRGDLSMIDLFADSSKWDGVLQGPELGMPKTSGDYSYIGCYAESGGKSFNTKGTTSNLNSVDSCRRFCSGSQLFGVQYGSECYCGSTIASTSKLVDDSQCGMTCRGNNSQYCGAGSRMQVYRLGAVSSSSSLSSSSTSLSSFSATASTATSSESASSTISSATSTPTPEKEVDGVSQRIGSFKYQGCYNEVGGRALTGNSKNDGTMTNRVCAAFCAGYSYFATEYSTECYCGNTLSASSLPVTDGRCNMPCKANSTEICGGPNGLTLFKLDLSSSSSSLSATASLTSSSATSASSNDSSTSAVSSTSIASSTSTTASPTTAITPVSTPLKCPASNGAYYVSNSQTFLVECGKDYAGNDMRGVGVAAGDLNACINICATTTGCKSVALSGGACYLKSGVGTPNSNGVWGARVVAVFSSTSSSSSPSSSSSSSSSSSASIASTTTSSASSSLSSTSSISSTESRSSSLSSSTATLSSSSLVSSSSSSFISASSGSSSSSTSASSGGSSSASSTSSSLSSSSTDTSTSSTSASSSDSSSASSTSSSALSTSSSSTSASSDSSTASSTASSSDSSSVSSTSSSSLSSSTDASTSSSSASSSSSSASASTSSSFSSSASSSASSSSPSSSSSTPLSTSSSTSSSTSTPASSSSSSSSPLPSPSATTLITSSSSSSTRSSTIVSSTATGPTVAPTAGIYYSLGCFGEPSGGRALSQVYTNNSMTVEMCAAKAQELQYDYMGVEYGVECWMGDSFDTTKSPSLASSRCNTLCPGNKSTLCGSGSTLQMYMMNSTLATPRTEVPAGTALACPANDDQSWTASNGAKFRIECGWDRNGGASGRVTVSSYEACLEACAQTTGCGSVALSGTDCYIKTGTLGTRFKKTSIRGATLLKPSS